MWVHHSLVYEALSSCHVHTVEFLRVRNSGGFVSDTLEVRLSRCLCFSALVFV